MAKSSKIPFAVISVGLRKTVDEPTAQKALLEINRLQADLEAAEQEGNGPEEDPKPKKDAITVVRPEDSSEIAWVVAHPAELSPHLVPDRIRQVIASYNESKKGRSHPVESIGEGIERIPGKMFDEVNIAIRTRTPATMIATGPGIDLPPGADTPVAGDDELEEPVASTP
jgi:hypothetical protein